MGKMLDKIVRKVPCINRLYEENEELKNINSNLINENKSLANENDNLMNGNKALTENNESLIKRCQEIEEDNKRVYAGHKSMEEEINFLKYRISTLDELHESIVQKEWPHDGSLKEYTCLQPFDRIEILPRGEVYTCCSAHIKHNYYIGNIYEDTMENIWNSEKVLKLRYSVTCGDFEYCSKMCRWLHMTDENVDIVSTNPIKKRETYPYSSWKDCKVETAPKYVTLTCDETCNLTCPSCRTCVKALSSEESEKLYERLQMVVRPMLKDCVLLGGVGSGDIFASKAISKFYKTLSHDEFPQLTLYIMTNAQLLTQKRWEEFENLHNIPIRLGISIDAAEKTTYEVNRRGAKWEVLIENLSFIKKWRESRENKINFLCFQFVVQNNNYMQMEEFVEFAEDYGADTVEFQKLGNWGTFSEKEYKEKNVLDKEHPFYTQTIKNLQDILNKEWNINIVQNMI